MKKKNFSLFVFLLTILSFPLFGWWVLLVVLFFSIFYATITELGLRYTKNREGLLRFVLRQLYSSFLGVLFFLLASLIKELC